MGFFRWLTGTQKNENKNKRTYSGALGDQHTDSTSWAYDDPDVIKYSEIYYNNLEKLEERYSVLYNLGLIEGSEVDDFIELCERNIMEFKRYKEACASYKEEMPRNVPAYKRLAMIYEKQGRYEEAIEICAAAIHDGVVDDGTKGRMRGRLARLIRKYGEEIPESISELLD